MKRIMFFLSVLLMGLTMGFSDDFLQGGIFINSATSGTDYVLATKTSTITNKLEVGRTYHLDKSGLETFELKLSKNQTVNLDLSIGVSVKVNPETTFFIDSFNSSVINSGAIAETFKEDYTISTFYLLEGEIYLTVPKLSTNSQSILQTPLVNVLLSEGKYFVRANPKYVMVNVAEGRVKVFDTTDKQNFIDKGNLAVAVPLDATLMIAQKTIEPEELIKINKSISNLQNSSKNVLFAVIKGEIVGIRLK